MERSSKSLVAKERVTFRIFRCEDTVCLSFQVSLSSFLAPQLSGWYGFLSHTKKWPIVFLLKCMCSKNTGDMNIFCTFTFSLLKRFLPTLTTDFVEFLARLKLARASRLGTRLGTSLLLRPQHFRASFGKPSWMAREYEHDFIKVRWDVYKPSH